MRDRLEELEKQKKELEEALERAERVDVDNGSVASEGQDTEDLVELDAGLRGPDRDSRPLPNSGGRNQS